MLDNTPSQEQPAFKEVNLLEYAHVILKQRQVLIWSVIIITGFTTGVSFLIPNTYKATATIMPIEKSSTSTFSSLLGSAGGGLTQFMPQALMMGSSNLSDKFSTILETRTIREALIYEMNLLPILFESKWDSESNKWKPSLFGIKSKPPSMQDGVKELSKLTSIQKSKTSSVISINVEHRDPTIAASIANNFVEELDVFLKENALSTAKRNRIFVEGQIDQTKFDLDKIENSLKDFQKTNKIISLSAQAEASVQAYASLKSKLIASEVELRILENSSIDGDPRVTLKKQEVSEISKQLSIIEDSTNSSPTLSFQKTPSLGVEYARLKRDLMVREKVFELLSQQLEMAKIQESQEDISFQILDIAIPPEEKSKPRRLLIILASFISSIFIGVLLALAKESMSQTKINFYSNQ